MNPVESLNPATGERVTLNVAETSVASALQSCLHAASITRVYSNHSLTWRSQLLRAMADQLEADRASLVEIAGRETALAPERLENELHRTAFQLRFFGEVILAADFLQVSIDHATDSPMGPLPDLRRYRVPLGPVAVFGSSNFPFAFSVPGGDTASALAAGCPVVIKAHPAHPATCLATFESLTRAARVLGAPEGLLSLVFGLEAGRALIEAPPICAVGFTGSASAGQYLWRVANDRPVPIPFYGELGSANPLVVTISAAAERAVNIGEGAAGSLTLGAGQFCTKPGLFFVPSTVDGDELVSSLANNLRKLPSMTMLGREIAGNFRSGVSDIAELPGVGTVVNLPFPDDDGARVGVHLFQVTAETFGDPRARRVREECFGPSAVVVRYSDRDQLEKALKETEPSLTFSIFRTDHDVDAQWLTDFAQSRAGRVIVDAFPTGVGVSWSMQHGGPWPSTTVASATSVGAAGIERWLRPVTFQNVPEALLPEALHDRNPLGVPQRVDGILR